MTKSNVALFVVLVWQSLASGQIVESQSMEAILKEATPNTLVLFDLDNTLMEPLQTLGSDQWVDHKRAEILKEEQGKGTPNAEKVSFDKILGMWKAVQKITEVKLIESGVPDAIKRIQDKGTHTMGLTARTVDMADTTVKQLKGLGIDLSRKSLAHEDVKVGPPAEVNYAALYTRGVLFSGLTKKGGVLVTFLGMIANKYQPKNIIFVDDKLSNCQSVEANLDKLDIPHTSYRYGLTDPTVKAYNRDIAELEWNFFGGILSDAAARAILGGAPAQNAR